MKFFASLGILGVILWLAVVVAVVWTWGTGVVFGFSHSIILGLVSLLPPVGFIEGLLHMLGVI